jgi:carboxylesterase type B
MGQPMVVASINYRLAHFGFTASKEFEDAGLLNLGFEDQRNALHWIQKHISKFGGDPTKVTIMGESAGSISVIQHLLYHAAIAMSGGPLKLEGPSRQQPLFDDLVSLVIAVLHQPLAKNCITLTFILRRNLLDVTAPPTRSSVCDRHLTIRYTRIKGLSAFSSAATTAFLCLGFLDLRRTTSSSQNHRIYSRQAAKSPMCH